MPLDAAFDDAPPVPDHRQMVFQFPFSMRPGAIIADVATTITHWQREGLTAPELWLWLCHQERNFVTWAQVEDFMIGWQRGQARTMRRAG